MNHNDICDHYDSCEMYALFEGSPALSVWKVKYCAGEYRKCQRYRNSLRQKPVPINLLPNGKILGAK